MQGLGGSLSIRRASGGSTPGKAISDRALSRSVDLSADSRPALTGIEGRQQRFSRLAKSAESLSRLLSPVFNIPDNETPAFIPSSNIIALGESSQRGAVRAALGMIGGLQASGLTVTEPPSETSPDGGQKSTENEGDHAATIPSFLLSAGRPQAADSCSGPQSESVPSPADVQRGLAVAPQTIQDMFLSSIGSAKEEGCRPFNESTATRPFHQRTWENPLASFRPSRGHALLVFDRVDTDGNGKITRTEMEDAALSLGLSVEKANSLFDRFVFCLR